MSKSLHIEICKFKSQKFTAQEDTMETTIEYNEEFLVDYIEYKTLEIKKSNGSFLAIKSEDLMFDFLMDQLTDGECLIISRDPE